MDTEPIAHEPLAEASTVWDGEPMHGHQATLVSDDDPDVPFDAGRITMRFRESRQSLLELPWDQPLARWSGPVIEFVDLPVGASRHTVRFLVTLDGIVALKELPLEIGEGEYEVLRDEMAGVLADINSLSDGALKAMQRAQDAEETRTAIETELAEKRAAYEKAKADLEGSLADVSTELEQRTAERTEFCRQIPYEPLQIYERVRRKHSDAMALVEGTIDRAQNRIGSDLHCSACYMTITANDAVRVLARSDVVQCKSCVRILYVP